MELEILNYLGLNDKIDFAIVAIYLLGGMFAKKYVNIPKVTTTYKTLIVGTLLTMIYVALMYMDGYIIPFAKVLLSYALATSLYELIIKTVKRKMNITETEIDNSLCENCPLNGLDGFYNAKEVTADELQNIVSQDIISSETILYCDNYIYVPVLLDNGTIDLQSNYVGARPPSKPVRK